jgi:hypothetical protein
MVYSREELETLFEDVSVFAVDENARNLQNRF